MRDFTENELVEVCSKSILFKGIEKEFIRKFLNKSNFKVISIKKGDFLLREGDYLDYICIVLEGKVDVTKYCIDGHEIIMSQIYPGEVIGLDIITTPKSKSFYNIIATDQLKVLKIAQLISNDELLKNEYGKRIMMNVINYLANENAKKCYKIEVVSQKRIRNKIMTYLLIQKKKHKSNKFKISFDRDQLANFLCINRSVLSSELSKMQKEGIIRFKKNEFEIL